MSEDTIGRPRLTGRPARPGSPPWAALLAFIALLGGCDASGASEALGAGDGPGGRSTDGGPAAERAAVRTGSAALGETLRRAGTLADSIEDILRPVRLMRPSEIQALRRYSNAENVERARRLGARPSDSAELASLVEQGRLVRLEDSTVHWVLRDMSSAPYVTPDTRDLLREIATRFHARLAAMGLPTFRYEISSVLRTAAMQASLRERNPNAAVGRSAHEFGTTVDIPYSAYAAPQALPDGLVPDDAENRDELETVARAVIERMAARKSRELKAILGEVMAELQAEGRVLVTLEQLQPVYHITLAQPRDAG